MSFISKILKKILTSDAEYQQLKESVTKNTIILENSTIDPNAKLYPPYRITDCTIDAYTYISGDAKLSMVAIGKFCSIGPNLFAGYGIHPTEGISTSPMFYSTLKQNGKTLSAIDKIEERKSINIGSDVFIGANVTILDGITIGDGAVIGAGAIVSKDIPPYAIAVGSPIQIIKFRFSEEQIKKLLEIKWWNFEEEKFQEIEKNFFNVNDFIRMNSHE